VITAVIVGMLATLASGLFLLVPNVPVPSWLTGEAGGWSSMLHGVAALNQFIDVPTGLLVLLAVLASVGAGVLVRLTRMVISHVTGGGGST